ncbi:MAG: MBL fold metallo-hydrolase [Taibaiella sp.]|nr:MBL fold metallo-hydrolase [Taibaiella sp.]
MSLSIASLNSGSNGNCYYISNEHEAVFIDAGLSCRETEIRMSRLGLSMQKVKAIIVSHEHSDHINGITTLSRKYRIPVYITGTTLQHSRVHLSPDLIRPFIKHQVIQVGGLSITSFPKFHDASDPHSFIVSGNGVTIGVFTDIGHCCDQVHHYFKQCHAIFLEANYDEEMLTNGRYPHNLKARIRGNNGHLSNAQALALFQTHRPSFMSHVILSHLSKDNNCPDLVQNLFSQWAANTHISIASRYKETPVYQIHNEKKVVSKKTKATQAQLQLFQ